MNFVADSWGSNFGFSPPLQARFSHFHASGRVQTEVWNSGWRQQDHQSRSRRKTSRRGHAFGHGLGVI